MTQMAAAVHGIVAQRHQRIRPALTCSKRNTNGSHTRTARSGPRAMATELAHLAKATRTESTVSTTSLERAEQTLVIDGSTKESARGGGGWGEGST
jgi:hypothetical protein